MREHDREERERREREDMQRRQREERGVPGQNPVVPDDEGGPTERGAGRDRRDDEKRRENR